MSDHYELSDAAFETAIKRGSLDPAYFTHEAHLRLAWLYIDKYGIDKAISTICDQLQQYVQIVGAADKYSVTVTVAAIRAVHHFKLKSVSDNFKDFIEEFPRLKTSFKDLLGLHYKTDIFNSEEAKKKYLDPEKLPFD